MHYVESMQKYAKKSCSIQSRIIQILDMSDNRSIWTQGKKHANA